MYSIVDSEVWQAPVQTEWYANDSMSGSFLL